MGHQTAGAGAVSGAFTSFCDLNPYTWSLCPTLIHVVVFSLLLLDMPCVVDIHRRPSFFLKRGVDWGLGKEWGGTG